MSGKHLLKEIVKEMSCKTVLDKINELVHGFEYDIQTYKSDILPLTYVIVYKFTYLNNIRLEISKKDNLINYKIRLTCNYNDMELQDNNFKEVCEEFEGSRVDILEFLKDKGKSFLFCLENNKHFTYAVDYLIDYAYKKKMNGLHIGLIKTKYMYGAYLIYKDVWLSDTKGYKNMYYLQGNKDRLKIVNSLVLQTKSGKMNKLNETIVYDGSALDLKAAWESMKYVVYESKEEKELSKKYQ